MKSELNGLLTAGVHAGKESGGTPEGVIHSQRPGRVAFSPEERLLWRLFAGSVGAATRRLVLAAIREKPRNAQQLTDALGLDYTTVRHHLRILERNGIIVAEGDFYGKLYFLSESMESQWDSLQAILEKATKKGER